MIFTYETRVIPDWIDQNGHMQDAYYGLIFSYAVDKMQSEAGFDRAYRDRTDCTIYLLEDHKSFLREVKEGARVRVETRVLDCDEKRFHLHLQMWDGDVLACVCEFMELHVQQCPKPHAAPIPEDIQQTLRAARLPDAEQAVLLHRSRRIGLKRD